MEAFPCTVAPGSRHAEVNNLWLTYGYGSGQPGPFLLQKQPGDLRGLPLLWEFSQGQWPPLGLHLSPHKASVGLV